MANQDEFDKKKEQHHHNVEAEKKNTEKKKGEDNKHHHDDDEKKKREPPSRVFRMLLDTSVIGTTTILSSTIYAPMRRWHITMQTSTAHHPEILAAKQALKEVKEGTLVLEAEKKEVVAQVANLEKAGAIRTLRTLLSSEHGGVSGLFRGNMCHIFATTTRQIPAFFIADYLPRFSGTKDPLLKFSMAATTGAIYGLFSYPFVVAETRFAANLSVRNKIGVKEQAGMGQYLSQCWSHGMRSCYSAYPALVLHRMLGGVAGYFNLLAYRNLQDYNPYKYDSGLNGPVTGFFIAAVPQMLTAPLSYPLDNAMRQIMIEADRPRAERRFHGLNEWFQKTMKVRGARGLFRGFSLELANKVAGPLVIVTYDRFTI